MPIAERSCGLVRSALALLLCACATRKVTVAPTAALPYSIAATAGNTPVTLDQLADAAVRADVVFFGEVHTDPETHRVELALLDAIAHRQPRAVLSLEMFERDVQPLLDDYMAGRTAEATVIERSRPWARYATDYRGLVELAKSRGWPVVAANIPRPLASAVARGGLAALDSLSPATRQEVARDIVCPDDDYKRRFLDEMKGHGAGGAAPSAGDTLPTAVAQRFYLAQCVKDETMAESIVRAWQAAGGAPVIHYDGAFHSDFGAGTVARVRRRLPSAKLLVISAIPVADPRSAKVADPRRADYIIFTRTAPGGPPS